MKRTELKRKTPLQAHSQLKRTPMKKKSSRSKASQEKEFSLEIKQEVWERSGGICEWCHQEPIDNIHHCKFRSQLSRAEGSGGLENALGIGINCDGLVHGSKYGRKYRDLFAERAKELAKGVEVDVGH